jgi:hypothetical protein
MTNYFVQVDIKDEQNQEFKEAAKTLDSNFFEVIQESFREGVTPKMIIVKNDDAKKTRVYDLLYLLNKAGLEFNHFESFPIMPLATNG